MLKENIVKMSETAFLDESGGLGLSALQLSNKHHVEGIDVPIGFKITDSNGNVPTLSVQDMDVLVNGDHDGDVVRPSKRRGGNTRRACSANKLVLGLLKNAGI